MVQPTDMPTIKVLHPGSTVTPKQPVVANFCQISAKNQEGKKKKYSENESICISMTNIKYWLRPCVSLPLASLSQKGRGVWKVQFSARSWRYPACSVPLGEISTKSLSKHDQVDLQLAPGAHPWHVHYVPLKQPWMAISCNPTWIHDMPLKCTTLVVHLVYTVLREYLTYNADYILKQEA